MPSNWTALEVKKCICFIKFVFFQGQRNVCLFDLFDFDACQTFMYEDQQPKSSLSFVRSMKLWKALKFTSKATFNAHSSCPHMATCPCAISEPKKTPEAISIINKNCVATTTQQIKYDSFNEFYKLQSVSIEKFTQLTHTFRWTNRISTSRCKGFFSLHPASTQKLFIFISIEKNVHAQNVRGWAHRNVEQKTSFWR